MSTDRLVDVAVTRSFPQPIAAAWHRAFTTTSEEQREKHVLATLDATLRTLGALVAADYTRGEPDSAVYSVTFLRRPSLGHWVVFLREATAALAHREAHDIFFAELIDWLWEAPGRVSENGRVLEGLVELRNRIAHNEPPPDAEALAEFPS